MTLPQDLACAYGKCKNSRNDELKEVCRGCMRPHYCSDACLYNDNTRLVTPLRPRTNKWTCSRSMLDEAVDQYLAQKPRRAHYVTRPGVTACSYKWGLKYLQSMKRSPTIVRGDDIPANRDRIFSGDAPKNSRSVNTSKEERDWKEKQKKRRVPATLEEKKAYDAAVSARILAAVETKKVNREALLALTEEEQAKKKAAAKLKRLGFEKMLEERLVEGRPVRGWRPSVKALGALAGGV